MKYFLLKSPSKAQGITDATNIGWMTTTDGVPAITPPVWCDLIPTVAIKSHPVYETDAEGNSTVVEPGHYAGGSWYIGSIENGEPPELIEHRIVAECKAGEVMVLPEGVIALSPILSGMLI